MRNLNIAKYQKREYISAPIDVYAQSLDTLQQKHEGAIEQMNANKAFLANKDLHESEASWAANLASEYQSKIDSAAESGSYATALTAAKVAAGEIASNKGLIGREKAQAAYKGFMENLDKNDKISSDVRDYTKAMTNYNYKDITDESGKVVGGTEWKPTYSPAESVDINKLYQTVLATVGVDQSQGGNLIWADETGKPIDKYREGALPMFKTTSGVTKLDPEKIRKAMESAIESTPGARASLNQDYKVNVWKARKGEATTIVKKDGTLMNQAEYEQSILSPKYQASAYTRITSDIDVSKGFDILESRRAAEVKAASNSGKSSGKGDKPFVTDFRSTIANVKVEPDTPAKVTSELNSARTRLYNSFAKRGIDKDMPDDRAYSETRRRINRDATLSDGMRQKELLELESHYNDMHSAANRLESVKVKFDEKEQFAIDFLGNRLSAGNMSNAKSNPFQERWAKAVNNMFTDDKGETYDSVIVRDRSSFDKVATALGASPGANIATSALRIKSELGLSFKDCTIKKIDGENALYISKNAMSRFAPEIAKILSGNINAEVYNESTKTTKDIRTHGNSTSISKFIASTGMEDILREVGEISRRSDRRVSDNLPPLYTTLEAAYVPQHMTVNGVGIEKNALEDYIEGAMNALFLANGASVKVMELGENGEMVPVTDSAARTEILRNIQSNPKTLSTGWAQNAATGEYGLAISKAQEVNSKGDITTKAGTYYIAGGVLNSEIEKFKNLPSVRAESTLKAIKYNTMLSHGYTLSENEWGDGTFIARLGGDNMEEMLIQNANGEVVQKMTYDEARTAMTNNYQFKIDTGAVKDFVELAKSNDINISDIEPATRTKEVVQPLMRKAKTDMGYSEDFDIMKLDKSSRVDVLRHFANMYSNFTNENLPDDVNDAVKEILK